MLKSNMGCHYWAFRNKVFTKNGNTSCWAGIQNYYGSIKPKYIYITFYEDDITNGYQKLLVDIINQITPCVFLTRQKIKYIKYQLLGSYNNDLVLLNFIRNLWHNPLYHSNIDYTTKFFEALQASTKTDALEKLTEANIIATGDYKSSPGHSNVNPKMKIKKTKDLLESKSLSSTNSFLTS